MTRASKVRAREREATGDPVGLALVTTLIERAKTLPASGRDRLLARAAVLSATYRARVPIAAPKLRPTTHADHDAWREALAARVRERAPRVRTEGGSTTLASELRATAATVRAAEQVSDAAGPYNSAAIASRALDELVSLAPGYVSSYVAWLEDLACLAELPERRVARRKT